MANGRQKFQSRISSFQFQLIILGSKKKDSSWRFVKQFLRQLQGQGGGVGKLQSASLGPNRSQCEPSGTWEIIGTWWTCWKWSQIVPATKYVNNSRKIHQHWIKAYWCGFFSRTPFEWDSRFRLWAVRPAPALIAVTFSWSGWLGVDLRRVWKIQDSGTHRRVT